MEFLLRFRLPLFLVGVLLFLINERYLDAETYHLYVQIAALVILIAGAVLPLLAGLQKQQQGLREEAKSWFLVLSWQLLVLLGIGMYLGYEALMGTAASPDSLGAKALLVGYLLALILGFSAGAGLEFTHRSSGTGALAEPRRVWRGGFSWLLVGIFLSFLICVNYIANKQDKAFDWSYLKTTQPGEATINILKSYDGELTLAIFYPRDNEVLAQVKEYFGFLADRVKKLKIEYYDVDLNPTKAEELKVSQNGQVILVAGEKHERLDIGLKLRSSASTLKKLDAEFQRTFLRLTESKKTLYFTRGHGELSWQGSERSPLASLNLMEKYLRSQNYTLKAFGLTEGSSTEVPDDAGAVLIVGADMPFMKEEAAALRRYLTRGGKLFVFLDLAKPSETAPSITDHGDDPLHALLSEMGIKFHKKLLANDRNFVTATRSPTDRWFLFSNSFTAHDSVTSLSRHDERIALLFYQLGYLDVAAKTGDWKATATVRALGETFVDENKNSAFDSGREKRDAYTLAAAATAAAKPATPAAATPTSTPKAGEKITDEPKKDEKIEESKVLVVADANLISDLLIRNPANAVFLTDGLKWLTGAIEQIGEIASEEDVKIQHTRKEDVLWFNGTVVGVPALVLAAGFFCDTPPTWSTIAS